MATYWKTIKTRLVLLASLAGLAAQATAFDLTWTGGTDSNWFNAANWSGSGDYPRDGDLVSIPSGSVLLTNTTAQLTSFTIANSTLTFTNWSTILRATTVSIQGAGTLTHSVCATNVAGLTSNRVCVECLNLSVLPGGKIDVVGRGYPYRQGPGQGYYQEIGGGYGGRGGNSYGIYGATYGLTNAPTDPGSGGGQDGNGGNGGGVVRISAPGGTVLVEGLIDATGDPGHDGYRGGGSGGSVYIDSREFIGTNGIVRANGGNGTANGGGGGGGRIAIVYDPAAEAAVTPRPTALISAMGGATINTPGESGTLYFPDTRLLQPMLPLSGIIYFESGTNWNTDFLSISNMHVGFQPDFSLVVTNNLDLIAGGSLRMGNATGAGRLNVGGDLALSGSRLYYRFADGYPETLAIGGNLLLTNASGIYLYAGQTNAAPTNHGGLLNLTGRDLVIPTNCAIYPYSHPTNGGSIRLLASNLTVAAGGSINADYKGYGILTGPGAGTGAGGGGYGGMGGCTVGGPVYGSANAPADPGSGGAMGGGSGGAGGGLVWVRATGKAVVDGSIRADGYPTRCGGSGGGVFLAVNEISGNGAISAVGGGCDQYGGAGGGGRIAVAVGFDESRLHDLIVGDAIPGLMVYTNDLSYTGRFSATNGVSLNPSYNGAPGSKRFLRIVSDTQRQLIVTGLPALYGNPATNGYGDAWIFELDTVVTNTVVSPLEGVAGMRWTCMGWRLNDSLTGALITNGSVTQAVFSVTTNLTLTWLWTNQYLLTVSAALNGTVNSNEVNNWYTNGAVVTGILATVDNPATHYFSCWSGNVPVGDETNNPLSLVMDHARTNVVASFPAYSGATKYWNGIGNWATPDNWSPAGEPGGFDTAILQSGTAFVNVAKSVASLEICGWAGLVFSNWNTSITVMNDVTIRTNGVVTHAGCNTNVAASNTNRVFIQCANLTIDAGGRIDVRGKGYPPPCGPGAGILQQIGGGHGGRGGNAYGSYGRIYDTTCAPAEPGSGGGQDGNGGNGGGVVRIIASGVVAVEGLIDAAGDPGHDGYRGGGSGGSIHIDCREFIGTGGVLRADGGNGTANGGSGGGGRIAVVYDPAAQSNLSVKPTLVCSAAGGRYGNGYGELGTLYFPDTQLLQPFLALSGCLYFGSGTNWGVAALVVSNGLVGFQTNFLLTVTNDLAIIAGGRLTMLNSTAGGALRVGGDLLIDTGRLDYTFASGYPASLVIGGDLSFTNSATAYLYAAPTNGVFPYGGLLSLPGKELSIGTNCVIYPYSDPTNGGSVKLEVGSLKMARGSLINADYRGFSNDYGPGKGGATTGGGGYGGQGGRGGGLPYGWTNAPTQPGSGGGKTGWNAPGGGLVWIVASGVMVMDGMIQADGGASEGGGSGGGVFLAGQEFSGAGTIRARGGGTNPYGGAGGGGRIAIWYAVPPGRTADIVDGSNMRNVVVTNGYERFTGTLSATNGVGSVPTDDGQPGTIVFLTVVRHGSVVRVR